MKRVVVTGMGAVTPVGNSVGEFWTSLINGVNGIEEITRFDTTDSKYRFIIIECASSLLPSADA